MMNIKKFIKKEIVILSLVFSGATAFFFLGGVLGFTGDSGFKYISSSITDGEQKNQKEVFVPTHIPVPNAVKGLYMTACAAATPSLREHIVNLADQTEINSIIIDVKDYTGTISFKTDNPALKDIAGSGCMISDLREFIERLHKKDIYVIARITVFQDPYYTKKNPELAIKRASDGAVWKDRKGLSFIDVGAKDFWEYIVALGKESYNIGFDELNFDYVRFPSDGNMKDIYFPFSNTEIKNDPENGKAKVLREFFKYLNAELKNTGAILSADLFGMTMTNTDDLNIGQILEYAEPYFDYICPMVYPSHYPSGFNGYKNVNNYPYEIIKFSMDEGVKRIIAATSSPDKLRPWLQDFDYPVTYTAEMVRKQKQATYDAGLKSWLMWDPANKYTREALD